MRIARRISLAMVSALAVILTASTAQAQAVKLLPNDTEVIFTINFQQILKSEVVTDNKALLDVFKEKFKEQLEEKGAAKYLKQAGFDPLVDLTSMTVAVPGAARNQKEVVVLLEGKFDADKIADAATAASKEQGGGLKVIQLANTKVFEVDPKGEGKPMYVGVLSKKYMLATATKGDYIDAIARLNSSKQSSLKPEVKALLGVVNNKQSISLIATGDALKKLSENLPQGAGGEGAKTAMDALQKLNGLSVAITIAKNIDFELGVNTQNNQTASEFASAVSIGLKIFKPNLDQKAKENPQMAPAIEIYDTIRAEAKGANLMIRAQVSYETLGKLLQNLPNAPQN